MTNAPVILFVYNRADHFTQTFAALSLCPEAADTELFIFADGPKNEAAREPVAACRAAVREATADCVFKSVHVTESPENRGLAASVIAGVSEVLSQYGRAIVLEDDCVASPYFLLFMNRALEAFETDERVGAVAGYTPALPIPRDYTADVFTCCRSCSCAWATWKDRWESVDWTPGAINAFYKDPKLIRRMNADGADRFLRFYRQTKGDAGSWSVRFGAHLVKNGMLTVYPRYSLIRNIGCDETGVHSTAADAASMEVDLSKAIPDPAVTFVAPDPAIRKLLKKHYSGGALSDLKRFAATALIALKGRFL